MSGARQWKVFDMFSVVVKLLSAINVDREEISTVIFIHYDESNIITSLRVTRCCPSESQVDKERNNFKGSSSNLWVAALKERREL